MTDPRSKIPGVDALLESGAFERLHESYPRARIVEAIRASIAEVRDRVAQGQEVRDIEDPGSYALATTARLRAADVPSLRRVINATGVVLHTNLGRAPLASVAIEAMKSAAEYSNLEYDLEGGVRGSRYSHCVSLLTELTGAEDALVVNNAAGALVLALGTVALGRGVAVSRGELVEIGGGFRIPEVMERSGADLVEIGSTNRTRIGDYRAAADESDVAALLKVHRSNFRISGFTEEASVSDLVTLGSELGVSVVHDLGSGLMLPAESIGLPHEPRAMESIEAGADIVVVSGDKLLGAPQAGVVVGSAEWIAKMKKNPLCRALRVDKVTLAGLEATLRLYRDPESVVESVPTLAMIAADSESLRARATDLKKAIEAKGIGCDIVETVGAVGGGTFPETELPSWGVALDGPAQHWADGLRRGSPAVVCRIVDERAVLDVRTIFPEQLEEVVHRALFAADDRKGES